jgi:hypothetical protein
MTVRWYHTRGRLPDTTDPGQGLCREIVITTYSLHRLQDRRHLLALDFLAHISLPLNATVLPPVTESPCTLARSEMMKNGKMTRTGKPTKAPR